MTYKDIPLIIVILVVLIGLALMVVRKQELEQKSKPCINPAKTGLIMEKAE